MKKDIKSNNLKLFFGYCLLSFSVFSFISVVSYIFTYHQDYKFIVGADEGTMPSNKMGKLGAYLGYFFLGGFGVYCFVFLVYIFSMGVEIVFKKKLLKTKFVDIIFYGVLFVLFFGFFNKSLPFFGGFVGYGMNRAVHFYLGTIGILILLFLALSGYILFRYGITVNSIRKLLQEEKNPIKIVINLIKNHRLNIDNNNKSKDTEQIKSHSFEQENLSEKHDREFEIEISNSEEKPDRNIRDLEIDVTETEKEQEQKYVVENISMDIFKTDEELMTDKQVQKLIKEQGVYDPKLDLSNYKYPPLSLLENREENINVDREELERNKNQIVDTLKNYKIDIVNIKATVGPTITLYEIVPAPGIRISKIQNLENDIALSLSALGIRIIAPMPGKGTIGIEVPNSNPSVVSMRSVLLSKKFQNTKMELPIALGKTISNETFIADLAKMPHMLMAGATGQGKSVGLNAILTSLLYKKHPAEIKFVLVDPKKVELTLFNKIERHFLAKLPNEQEAIITDTNKVINTLNSLCLEMDERYNLLKDAMVRNIKEYNHKFINRRLNPNEHRYLPYIVLVIDEFADLIMTAGKEVELPIARLAQLARAVGIHLIVATQRPSVNVITGVIKANFPARVAFRVTSKIDSRTILDASGADQLIGKGDMLFSTGNDLIRIQCAFVDTPEINDITEYIGSQQGYPQALFLPEYEPELGEGNLSFSESEKDEMFNDAARLVVATQQGSTSLIQRKLKLGYNRAGRIIDQLEAFGIVGPFEGSKARQVLVQDENTLEKMLNSGI